jgi:hypothetical protein
LALAASASRFAKAECSYVPVSDPGREVRVPIEQMAAVPELQVDDLIVDKRWWRGFAGRGTARGDKSIVASGLRQLFGHFAQSRG